MEMARIKKCLLALCTVALVLGSDCLFAQGFATVDTRILLILHPLMVDFDYNNGVFYRNPSQNKISKDMMTELQKAQKKADVENEKIEKQIKELESERYAASSGLMREMNVFAPGERKNLEKEVAAMKVALAGMKGATVADMDQINYQDKKIKEMEKQIAELDSMVKNPAGIVVNEANVKQFEERIASIDKRIYELKLEISANNEKAMSTLFLTRKETEERLSKIRTELKEIINTVAAEEGCSMVIDNTYGNRGNGNTKNRAIISSNENPDVGSSALFRSFLSFNPDLEGLDTNVMSEKEAYDHIALGAAMGLEQNLHQYLEYKDWVPAKVADFSFGSLFISGGKDLTVSCAKRLFDKYDVPEFIRQRFAPKLSEFLKTN